MSERTKDSLCCRCNSRSVAPQYPSKKVGQRGFSKYCRTCRDDVYKKRRPVSEGKQSFCIRCGPLVKYHYCQLDIDHIDGNHFNNQLTNLQTLCANCHRIKTYQQLHGE